MGSDLYDLRELGVDLSADKRWRTFDHGDFQIIIAWTPDKRPCLCILPGRLAIKTNISKVPLIPDLMAWAWSEELGDGGHCFLSCTDFLECLHFDVTKRNLHRLFSLITEHLDDLITCPPPPAFRTFAAAITKHTNKDTGKITEGEIIEDV